MKLYYGVNACSLAVLIAATEAGLPVDLVKVDIYTTPHTLPDGTAYAEVNPRLYVPLVEFDDGSHLGEVAVLLQYVADHSPSAGLAPDRLSPERYRTQEWLNYISSEIHKSFSPWLFHPEVGAPAQDAARSKIAFRLQLVEEALIDRDYVDGKFGIVDAYLYTVLSWSKFAKVSLEAFPRILAWYARVAARPAVKAALARHV